MLWSLDNGYEFVDAADTLSPTRGHDEREKDGVPRVLEAPAPLPHLPRARHAAAEALRAQRLRAKQLPLLIQPILIHRRGLDWTTHRRSAPASRAPYMLPRRRWKHDVLGNTVAVTV